MSHSNEGSVKAIFFALAANGGIAISKFFAAWWTGSGSMLAEAIHSTADCVNQLLLLLGMKEANRPESEDHPLGHHRVTYFWSMIVALMLFFIGGAFSVYEGVERLHSHEPLSNGLIALLVLGVAVVLEAISLWGAMREIKSQSNGKSFIRWFRESRQSELMVVASEDIAALLGLLFAFIAVAATVITGNPIWDAVGSILIGTVLMAVAFAVMIEVKALIVGESLAPEVRQELAEFIDAQPEVETVLNIITQAWGDKMIIAVKARMADMDTITGAEMVRRINEVEDRIQVRWPEARWVFFEPDVR
jgi:cation diffusion facilitator family transporter